MCLSTDLLTHLSQEEPFDLSQKPPGLHSLCLSQSDGESVPGSSCQEEDEESFYRRSLYSPEVDQHVLEERDHRSPADPMSGEQKQTYQCDLDKPTYERESGAEEDPRGDKTCLLQSRETACESDSETGRRWSYDYGSDSEHEDHHRELNEPEQRRPQPGGFYDVEERSQNRLEAHDIVGVKIQHDVEDIE